MWNGSAVYVQPRNSCILGQMNEFARENHVTQIALVSRAQRLPKTNENYVAPRERAHTCGAPSTEARGRGKSRRGPRRRQAKYNMNRECSAEWIQHLSWRNRTRSHSIIAPRLRFDSGTRRSACVCAAVSARSHTTLSHSARCLFSASAPSYRAVAGCIFPVLSFGPFIRVSRRELQSQRHGG